MDLIEYKNGVVTDTDINDVLQAACDKFNFENLESIGSTQFSVCLRAVGQYLKSIKALKQEGLPYFKYDVNKISILSDYYIYICNLYNKRIYTEAFLYFVGIGNNEINSNGGELSASISAAGKKFIQADAQRVMNQATDSKQAILNIAYNNFVHSWNGQIKSNEIKTTVKTLDQIKQERLQQSADGAQNARFSLDPVRNTPE